MGLARTLSRGQAGLDAYLVTVEVHLAGGLPGFAVTGLPAAAVRESKDRVRAALSTSGYPVPVSRITVHLGPADIPKTGGRFDLAIALGVLLAQQEASWPVAAHRVSRRARAERRVAADHGCAARGARGAAGGARARTARGQCRRGGTRGRTPRSTSRGHFNEVVQHLAGGERLPRVAPRTEPVAANGARRSRRRARPGVRETRARRRGRRRPQPADDRPARQRQEHARRALERPAAAARRTTKCCASRASPRSPAIRAPHSPTLTPPFRAPHHTTSAQALVGGGTRPKPGEISLAHRGVLFLDELPEFSRSALEALREPLESGVARISRVHEQLAFPAEFMLVGAMNPCFCGFLGDGTDRCQCTPYKLEQYRNRISGPLLDRFDLHVEVPRVPFADIAEPAERRRVRRCYAKRSCGARRVQLERDGRLNARLDTRAAVARRHARRGATRVAEARCGTLAAQRAAARCGC